MPTTVYNTYRRQPMNELTVRTPMNTKYRIAWEKWNDPYGQDADIKKNEEYNDGYSDYDEDVKEVVNEQPMKFIATPMGLIPLTEHTTASKIFNFWTGHTNFSITNDIAHMIERTDGVETLDIFTRYRLKVGIGKMFVPANVMNSINESLQKYFNKSKK